jgi:ribosomal protein S18 acetylase RimI-like enzyme
MARTVCMCRTEITAAEDSELFAAMRAHCDSAHADLKITDEQIRHNLAVMAAMSPWDDRTALLPGPVEVRPLTPERQRDFLDYFDREAFTDNPGWASCYCFYYRFDGGQEAWNKRNAEQNRAAQSAAIEAGEASGYLAYSGGRVVGWCHAAPRGDLPLLDAGQTAEGDDSIASIVCFNVKPAHRGQGVASTLLASAAADLFTKGFSVVEAYPLESPRDNGQAYHGPLAMYLEAGFERVGEQGHYVVVRKRA